jgi:uncharacterized membrane protein required for colicin V production
MKRTSFRMDPMGLGALIGAIVVFVVVGAIVQTLYVLLGAAVGAGIGWVIRRFAAHAVVFEEAIDLRETATKAELYEEATKLGIEGRSGMTKDQLVAAITEARSTAA